MDICVVSTFQLLLVVLLLVYKILCGHRFSFLLGVYLRVEILGFFIYSIMSPANSVSFTSSLPIWMPLFFFFSRLIAVARTSNTMLNINGESGHPCLVPDFRGKAFIFSPLSMMLAVGLS